MLSSGDVFESTDGMKTTAEFLCADGYHLVGQSVLECLDDGIWNASIPVCGELYITKTYPCNIQRCLKF